MSDMFFDMKVRDTLASYCGMIPDEECLDLAREVIAMVQGRDDPYTRRETKPLARPPKWTILYNRSAEDSKWVGTGWEFFDDKKVAHKRYDELNAIVGCSATLRPYYRWCDFRHLGAVHSL